VLLIEPRVFEDDRGFFLESFNAGRFSEHGLPNVFPQENHSRSRRGVLRGLHYQLRRPQGKLVTVVRGEVFDVAVDIRRGSPCFGRWFATTLSGEQPRFLWIPPGFAHGYCVLSDSADFLYKCTETYAPDDDHGVLWSDRSVGIKWPVQQPFLSARDANLSPLSASRDDLPEFTA
jgi:dTDP-4-dehydrorhamnose 3,5-epimerase